MLKNHLLVHRKLSTHYSTLNTSVSDLKNVLIRVKPCFKNSAVSRSGLQLESLGIARRKAKKKDGPKKKKGSG